MFPTDAFAGNPIIKDSYTADPAPLVYDGKVYLYVGNDEAGPDDDFFVLREWSIYSSSDLINWEYEGAFERTAFEWGMHDTAWAAQAIERDGKFYWYTTVRNNSRTDPGYAIGVAHSDDPVHGWEDALGEPLITSSMTDSPDFMGNDPWDVIDPTVFIDDDGQAYLYWGNTHLYYAKLKDNMIELDGDIHQVEIQNMPGSFTEGPWLHKYEDQYYLTYAMNYPEEIGYAVSDHPEGPWEFKATIMDRIPNSATSHPGVIEFEDEWYFFYHTAALPGGGEYNRSVSIERMHYYDDGTIAKLTPTASGIATSSYLIQPYDTDLALRQITMALRVADVNEEHFDFRWHETSSLLDAGDDYVSYQIENNPGVYLVRSDNMLRLEKNDGSESFAERATFRKIPGLANETAYSLITYDDEYYVSLIDGSSIGLQTKDELKDDKSATFTIQQAEDIIPEQPNDDVIERDDSTEVKDDEADTDMENNEAESAETETTEADDDRNVLAIVLILVSLFIVVLLIVRQNKKS